MVERDGDWYIAYCAEIPGANGQGQTREECLDNLKEAIRLLLETEREEVFRLASDRKWRVRELSQRGATLEDVFVEMTHAE